MKSAWFAAFALPVLCASLSYSQAAAPVPVAANDSSDAKATTSQQSVGNEPGITEAELRQKLVGRPLYLRGLWLDENLHFNMNGDLVGQSPKGSFTLCGINIDHVRMTKKTVELEGIRFGVHFEGEAPWGDQATSFDRIQITPKKKHQVIVIDRQLVVIPKKKKEVKEKAGKAAPSNPGASSAPAATAIATAKLAANADTAQENASTNAASPETATPAAGATTVASAGTAPSVAPTTISPAESAGHLRTALNKIFAPDLDEKMVAQMPDYWQFFYQAQQSHKSLEPTDSTLVHPGPGIDGPRLLKNVVPASNDFAQRGEVAGVASYKVILDPQGKILAVAVYRPIGFGLDENAVAAIQKSSFAPAVKDGKPVSSVIDVAVNFRIYSKRTATGMPEAPETAAANADTAAPGASPVTGKPSMPGLYSALSSHPQGEISQNQNQK